MLIKKILAAESLGMVYPERQLAEPGFGGRGLALLGGLKGWALVPLAVVPSPLVDCGWTDLPFSLTQARLFREAFISTFTTRMLSFGFLVQSTNFRSCESFRPDSVSPFFPFLS